MGDKLTDILFDHMPFAAYAIDIQTYEVVYMNSAMKEHIRNSETEFCWGRIHNQDNVCAWCQVSNLQQKLAIDEKPQSTTEFFDEESDRWIKNYNQLIKLPNGDIIKYTIVVDITDQKEIQGSMIKSHAQLAIKSKQLKTLNDKLNKTLIELHRANEKLTFLANKDYLTGINNRRVFFEIGTRLFKEYPQNEANLYAIMMDIDKFKSINDTYGHAVGDEVLRLFTKTIEHNLDKDDIFGRLGGEEFAILTTDNSNENIFSKIDKIREIISKTQLKCAKFTINFTVSSGISMKHREDTSIDSILERADRALYNAKHNGRNKVEANF